MISLVIRHLTVGCLVPVRVNVPVRGSRPRKSHSAQIFQYPERMLWKPLMYSNVDVGCSASYLTRMLNKYFIAQVAENTFSLHRKKKSKQEYRTTHLRVNLKQKISACFSKPSPILSDAEMKILGNSIVRFFKICLQN